MSEVRVLVIDDEDIVLKSCYRVLTPEGYDVKMATKGLDGLQMLKNDKYDVVLVDVKMPDMDGIEVLRRIKKEWPDIPVIIITGYSAISDAVFAIKLGAYDYIEKPFAPDTILSSVKKALGYEMEEQEGK
ncbi:MAG: response regulator [Nitrospirota bacterium]